MLVCTQQEKGSLCGETVEASSYTSNNRKAQDSDRGGRGFMRFHIVPIRYRRPSEVKGCCAASVM